MLTPSEQKALDQAYRLTEITKLEGWKDLQGLLSDISQKFYPDPKDKKYKYFPWEHIEKDYTFARGATEAIKEFISIMMQQEDVARNLQEKADKLNETLSIGQ